MKLSQPAIEAELERLATKEAWVFIGIRECDDNEHLPRVSDMEEHYLTGARAAIALMLEREKVLREALESSCTDPYYTRAIGDPNREFVLCGRCDACKALTQVPEWKHE